MLYWNTPNLARECSAGQKRGVLVTRDIYLWSREAIARKPYPSFSRLRRVSDTIGKKAYELDNHLGNVLETVTDKRLQVASGGSVGYYTADVAAAQDYYPFGMLMPGRQYTFGSDSSYRYGFNGQEKSDEIAGSGNHNTALFWEYDTRVGRRWNLDPKPNAEVSSYSAFSNNPIAYSDLLGDTVKIYGNAEITHTTLIDKGAVKDQAGNAIHIKGVTLVPELDRGNKLIGYNVFDDSNTDRNMPILQLEPRDLEGFKTNINGIVAAARVYYSGGEPSDGMKQVSAGLAMQNFSYALGGVKKEWKGALHDPTFIATAILATLDAGVRLKLKEPYNPMLDAKYKQGSSASWKAFNKADLTHSFSNIVKNYGSYATEFKLTGKDGVIRQLFQIEGSLHGVEGRFEWILEKGEITHR